MAISAQRPSLEHPLYPSSDGKPMSDNTKQFRWIVTLQGGLDALFRDDPNVFVAGDLLWYPVEGKPKIRRAPDAMVVFGRPKGDRGAYLQWLEGGIAPQVVFEVLSPKNTPAEMAGKWQFYQTYGVEEYYLYDPDGVELTGWLRRGERFQVIEAIDGWASPLLGVRFSLGDELQVYRPDGERFLTFLELERQRDQAEAERARAEAERARAEAERARAEAERRRAELLAARLRALGVDPDEVM